MGVRKFRSAADVPPPPALPRLDPGNLRSACELSSLERLRPVRRKPGVYRFRSIEEMKRARDESDGEVRGIRQLLTAKRSEILRVAKAHGAGNVRVFGSVARGEASLESDVDLLVDLEPGRSLLDHAALMLDLESLLGRRVDVAVARGLRPRIRERVLKEAVPL